MSSEEELRRIRELLESQEQDRLLSSYYSRGYVSLDNRKELFSSAWMIIGFFIAPIGYLAGLYGLVKICLVKDKTLYHANGKHASRNVFWTFIVSSASPALIFLLVLPYYLQHGWH